MSFGIRRATPEDIPALLGLIRALAEYEKLLDLLQNDAEKLRSVLFSDQPRVFCDLAEIDDVAVGYAIWFYSYSTFLGRLGIYLEDVFVLPEHRGAGIGKAFLGLLAERCVAEGLGRLEWSVLDWNEPSIGFYRSLGAGPLEGWTVFRLTGEELAALGGERR